MLLDPFKLAAEVARVAGLELPGPTLSELARALGNKQGVALDDETAYLVLGNPLAGDDKLTLVAAPRPLTGKGRKARTRQQVASAFRLTCGGANLGRPPAHGSWLPALIGSDARVQIGGSLPQPTRVSANGYSVDWYRLYDIPEGALFYYLQHNGHLAVYQRISTNYFALIQVPHAYNMVRMSEVVASLTPRGEKVEKILPTGGPTTLLRPPPE